MAGDRREHENKSSNIRTAEKGPSGESVPEGLFCLVICGAAVKNDLFKKEIPMQRTHHNIRIWEVGLALVAVFLFVGPAAAKGGKGGEHLQSWSQKIDDADKRFKVLEDFNDEAVLDKETQLVWELSPGDIDGDGDVDNADKKPWIRAIIECAMLEVGGRKGWHLPMREQLATLVDTSNSNPALPTLHPFQNVQNNAYWSATSEASAPGAVWIVLFTSGLVTFGPKTDPRFIWCVRGGQVFDGNTHTTLH